MRNVLQYIPVAVQAAAMCFVIFTTSRFPTNPVVLALLILSAGLMVWSVRSMGPRKVNMSAHPDERIQICTHGPYRWIRHPMYTSALAFTLVLVVYDFGWMRAIAWGILFVNMAIKTVWEERLLMSSVPDYQEYARRTKRMVPFLF